MRNISVGLMPCVATVVTLLMIATGASANTTTTLKKASTTDQELAELFPQSCYFSGHFIEQKRLAGLPEPLLSEGQFMFACDRGLSWYTRMPIDEALLYSLGQKNFQYSQSTQAIAPLKGRLHKNIGKLLVGIMGADLDYIDQYFQLIDEPRVGKPYRFIPRKKAMRKFISELRLQKVDDATRGTNSVAKSDVKSEANIVVEFDQPNVGSTTLTIGKVQYHQQWSMLDCLATFNNNAIVCERFSTLNTLSAPQPYDDDLAFIH